MWILNIWHSALQTWDTLPLTYPVEYRYDPGHPAAGHSSSCPTQDAVLAAICDEYSPEDDSEGVYVSVMQKVPGMAVYDAQTQDMMQRYNYCEQFASVPPYPGGYDQQPALWVDFSHRMVAELPKIAQRKARQRGN